VVVVVWWLIGTKKGRGWLAPSWEPETGEMGVGDCKEEKTYAK